MHDNARALHEYTRHESKRAASGRGGGFDGELNDFQQPELRSFERLVCLRQSSVFFRSLITLFIVYGRYPAAMIGYAPSGYPRA